jgi:hypothetical protein
MLLTSIVISLMFFALWIDCVRLARERRLEKEILKQFPLPRPSFRC